MFFLSQNTYLWMRCFKRKDRKKYTVVAVISKTKFINQSKIFEITIIDSPYLGLQKNLAFT